MDKHVIIFPTGTDGEMVVVTNQDNGSSVQCLVELVSSNCILNMNNFISGKYNIIFDNPSFNIYDVNDYQFTNSLQDTDKSIVRCDTALLIAPSTTNNIHHLAGTNYMVELIDLSNNQRIPILAPVSVVHNNNLAVLNGTALPNRIKVLIFYRV